MKFFKPSIRPIFKTKNLSSERTLSDVGPMTSHLKTRSVVRFRGPDTLKFLQALLTNDVRRFGNPIGDEKSTLVTPNVPVSSARSMYAAMLAPQGRFLFDMFLYEAPRVGEKLDPNGSTSGSGQDDVELFADVDSSVLDEMLETLKKYKVRSKIDIENVGQEFSCWQRFGSDQHKKTPSSVEEDPEGANVGWGASVDQTGSSSSQGNNIGFQWHKDPRLDCLGFRGIFPSNTTPPLVEANTETDEANYLLWRLEKGVAEGSIEIPKGEAIPLEYNLVGLNAISFDKGCYMGQEFIARSHHRGVIRKRLLPLKFLNESGTELQQKVAPSSEVLSLKSGKKAGTVTTALGSRGLGLLRLEEAFTGSGNLVIKGQEDVKVEPIRPEWWPTEWFSDYEPHQHSSSG